MREDSATWKRGSTLNRNQFGAFFHGTRAELNPGDKLVPGRPNYRTSSSQHVYSTTNEDVAWNFAHMSGEQQIDLRGKAVGERSRVYEVEPQGDLHEDPERIPEAYRSETAAVLKEIPGPRGAQLRLGGGFSTPADQKREAQDIELQQRLKNRPSEEESRRGMRAEMVHELSQQDLFGEKKTYSLGRT